VVELGPLSPQTEASIDFYKTQSPDYQRGYDKGWEDAYRELEVKDEQCTPPWFRRFFWYPKSNFDGDKVPYLTNLGHDDWCNPVLGIRLRGGVLNIRYGWKRRMPKDGQCNKCAAEEKAWRDSRAS
jgi:hypothetical protein